MHVRTYLDHFILPFSSPNKSAGKERQDIINSLCMHTIINKYILELHYIYYFVHLVSFALCLILPIGCYLK